jgi:P27 family predicted phage terminase small subunit
MKAATAHSGSRMRPQVSTKRGADMKRGPQPKPTKLKKLAGNPGKRALPKNEPQPEPVLLAVEPPTYLSAIAQEEWRRLSPQLIGLGLLTVADFTTFAGYCVAYADFVTAECELQKGTTVTVGKEKQPVRSPWFIIKYKALEAMMRIGDRFGLSPAARVPLAATLPEQPPALPPPGAGVPNGAPKQSLDTFLANNPDRAQFH